MFVDSRSKSRGLSFRVPFCVRYSHDGFLIVGIYLDDMPMLNASYDILFSHHLSKSPHPGGFNRHVHSS